MFSLPVSTLRYYDNQGFFPDMIRESGIRKFGEKEIETLRIIECLKKSGLEIKDIKQFIDWCVEGETTFEKRRALFVHQKQEVEAEIERMNRVKDMLTFKCWFYDEAIRLGSDSEVKKMIPDGLPSDIRKAYDNAHSND